jgi:predicted RNase H-like nuclease
VDAVGVDACPTGWVGVTLREGRFADADTATDLARLLAGVPAEAVVGIDIPLGLLEIGRRRADTLASALLAPHRSRIFPVPPRPVWEEDDYEAANLRCRRLTGSGLSRQSWGLMRKLREANDCRESGDHRLHEVHPEVSFAAMNDGRPVAWSKKSWNGQALRRRLLREEGITVPEDLGAAGRVPPDDVLDAAAAAWSAHRIALHTAETLPDPPEATSTGLPVAIWY